MVVLAIFSLAAEKEEFDKLAVDFAKSWNDRIPTEEQRRDKMLIVKTVGSVVRNEIVIVRPEEEEDTLDKMARKYITNDYTIHPKFTRYWKNK